MHTRFVHLARLIHEKPWLVTPQTHATIRRLFEAHYQRRADNDDDADEDGDKDFFGNPIPSMQVVDGIAIIPVAGVIGKGMSAFEKACGAVDTIDIANNIRAALADPLVAAIMLDIDSPGGTVNGVPECAGIIAEANAVKPVMCYSDGEVCSAAYWIASQCGAIYGSVSAEFGSIGVYLPWIDETAAYAKEGLSVELIKNSGGDFKGAGYPGTALTDDQKAELQRGVDQIFGMFTGAITAARPGVPAAAMRGQTFLASEAMSNGLIDNVASRETALSDLMMLAKMRN